MVCTLQWVRGLTQLWTENSRWEGVGSCQCSVQLLKALKPLFIFNNICSFLFHLFTSISCVPNGEQYRLLQLLGDISTVQDVHVQMWWSVMCFFPEFKVSFPESQLVITEMKKPSLVLSKAAPALWYKDHHSLQIYTLLPAAPLRIFQTQASGVWSHLLKQCQQNKHQEVKKLLAVDDSSEKNLLIWSHPSIALSQGATHSSLFLCRQCTDSLTHPHSNIYEGIAKTPCANTSWALAWLQGAMQSSRCPTRWADRPLVIR